MAFTTAELENIANAALEYYIKGPAISQTIQDKPLLNAMMGKQKTFPGGKENIAFNVKGDYTTEIEGYTHNDTVTYQNPANLKQASFPWKEVHAGITLTLTELKKDGISVVDSLDGKSTTEHSQREMTVITGLLQDKLEDMSEGWARSMNAMFWLDGTQDAKQVPGIKSIIVDEPDAVGAIVGGINGETVDWWRNRALVGADAIASSPTNQTLTKTLRAEVRQLKRYGGKPTLLLAGSAFIEALEAEIHEKGAYTDSGFIRNGTTDIGMADISMRGVGTFVYDPTLDDIGESKRCYFIDVTKICPYVMEGEDRKLHNPARPHDQYVLYRAMTWTGGLIAKARNGSGVYEVE
jgi:hypothetical protein